MRRRARAQAMVEFALIAPLFMALFVGLADTARGFLAYNELAMASRAGARQAVLEYNAGSNTAAPSCNPSTCSVPGVMPAITQIAQFGFSVQSYSYGSPPSYCAASSNSFTSGSTAPPLTLSLSNSAVVNTVYACIYEFDPSTGTVYWAPGGSSLARAGGHQLAVVYTAINWQPVMLSLLHLGTPLRFWSQTVQRIEY